MTDTAQNLAEVISKPRMSADGPRSGSQLRPGFQSTVDDLGELAVTAPRDRFTDVAQPACRTLELQNLQLGAQPG